MDQILGTEQYFDFRSYVFFRSYAYFYLDFQSSGFLLIRSSEFGLMDQLVIFLPYIGSSCRTSESSLIFIEQVYLIFLLAPFSCVETNTLVVYFDQQTGAPLAVPWPGQKFVFALKQVFFVFFSH